MITLTHAQWTQEAVRRYGPDPRAWKFRCPSCGHAASVAEWEAARVPENTAFSCIGRTMPEAVTKGRAFGKSGGPCNYAGGGLFKLNPIQVEFAGGKQEKYFDFADEPLQVPA